MSLPLKLAGLFVLERSRRYGEASIDEATASCWFKWFIGRVSASIRAERSWRSKRSGLYATHDLSRHWRPKDVRLDRSRTHSGAVIVWSGMSRVPGGTADLTAVANEKLPAQRADLIAGGCAMLPHRWTPASFIQGRSAAAARWPTRNEKQPIHLPPRLHV